MGDQIPRFSRPHHLISLLHHNSPWLSKALIPIYPPPPQSHRQDYLQRPPLHHLSHRRHLHHGRHASTILLHHFIRHRPKHNIFPNSLLHHHRNQRRKFFRKTFPSILDTTTRDLQHINSLLFRYHLYLFLIHLRSILLLLRQYLCLGNFVWIFLWSGGYIGSRKSSISTHLYIYIYIWGREIPPFFSFFCSKKILTTIFFLLLAGYDFTNDFRS